MGTITTGVDADAILLDANPLADVTYLIDPRHRRAGHLVHCQQPTIARTGA
ncbi:hypothetical protein LFM09_09605 [Lentzea alba]|uniref:hypothetical protein n=1 Tax=Lentzea alba TaxID=2714351 RepID=UPI0039BFA7D6